MAHDAYGNHLCDDCMQRGAEEDVIIDNFLYSLCKSCYEDRMDEREVEN